MNDQMRGDDMATFADSSVQYKTRVSRWFQKVVRGIICVCKGDWSRFESSSLTDSLTTTEPETRGEIMMMPDLRADGGLH